MRAIAIVAPAVAALLVVSGPAMGQTATPAAADSAREASAPPAEPAEPREKRVYFGGTIGLSFGEPTHVGIYPMIGYKLTRQLSIGGKIGYEYLKYDHVEGFNNYGGSVFTRIRPLPRMYGHAEYQWISSEFPGSDFGGNDRDVVPYFLVGAGFVQPFTPTTAGYVEILFDLIQDEHSAYDSGEPIINFGVTVGF
jgi:hypothetical protein